MALFIIGSWIYIFEPHSWLPITLGLSTLNYCATPMSCAMYLQCVGKHLESTYYAIKEIQIDTTTQGQLRDMPEDKSDINNTNMRPS